MIPPLEPPDSFHLLAAHGWLELGNHIEAEAELEKIASELQAHPKVLQKRWAVYATAHQWDAAVDIGRALVELEPGEAVVWVHRADVLRRACGVCLQVAHEALRPAAYGVAESGTRHVYHCSKRGGKGLLALKALYD
jgi:hypothetical protein